MLPTDKNIHCKQYISEYIRRTYQNISEDVINYFIFTENKMKSWTDFKLFEKVTVSKSIFISLLLNQGESLLEMPSSCK